MKIVKNKLAPPFKTAEFELEFGKGISNESEIIDLAIKHKFITKAGAIYNHNGQIFRGKDSLKNFLLANNSVKEELVTQLREKLIHDEKEPEPEDEEGVHSEEIVSADSTDEEALAAVEA